MSLRRLDNSAPARTPYVRDSGKSDPIDLNALRRAALNPPNGSERGKVDTNKYFASGMPFGTKFRCQIPEETTANKLTSASVRKTSRAGMQRITQQGDRTRAWNNRRDGQTSPTPHLSEAGCWRSASASCANRELKVAPRLQGNPELANAVKRSGTPRSVRTRNLSRRPCRPRHS